ncbi:MAG: hypothetical protein LAO56_08430 [Acidobacteriia bacterium]|nr:hypothetical protein [Terriglobia bacterium]
MSNAMIEMDTYSVAPIDGPAGSDLAWRFFGLGNLTGKTAAEIIASVGMPTFESSMANGLTLLQWHARGFDLALLFNADGRAVKITHDCARFALQN